MNKTILTLLLFCFAVFSVSAQVENTKASSDSEKSAVVQNKTTKEKMNEKGAVQTNPQADNPNAPDIQFDKMVHDYGTIEQNADGSCKFKFVNVGKEPLILSNVRSS
ncbi:MAG: DUF1573 domain-containing protein [Bacteroidales bacterium]|nr:DUF1573 domain-containing protein [Bacteroidales bacterium]MCF8404001.1 DUF1573 domain-containing protein [Bacteroidales bacterium]